jgi:hypothetical protein
MGVPFRNHCIEVRSSAAIMVRVSRELFEISKYSGASLRRFPSSLIHRGIKSAVPIRIFARRLFSRAFSAVNSSCASGLRAS